MANTPVVHPQLVFTLPPVDTKATFDVADAVTSQPSDVLSEATYGTYLSYAQYLWKNGVFSRALAIFYQLLRICREMNNVIGERRADRIHAYLSGEFTFRGDYERALYHLAQIKHTNPDKRAFAIMQIHTLMGKVADTPQDYAWEPENVAVARLYGGSLTEALEGLRSECMKAAEKGELTQELRDKAAKLYELQRS